MAMRQCGVSVGCGPGRLHAARTQSIPITRVGFLPYPTLPYPYPYNPSYRAVTLSPKLSLSLTTGARSLSNFDFVEHARATVKHDVSK